MPELNQIQTYEKINDSDYKPTIECFSRVLHNIGLWTKEVENAFERFEWEVEDDGFVYSSITQVSPIFSEVLNVEIRPWVMVYTIKIDDAFKDYWISCEFLIETEKLRSFENGEFYDTTYQLVKFLTSEMQKEFKQTGIYFTDEVQDGKDFNGIINNDSMKLWQFDYALIPFTLENLYNDKPKNYSIRKSENGFEVWNIDRWKEKPSR